MKFNWYGWSNSRSGYGIVNLEYATILDKLTKGGVYYGWERERDMLPEEWAVLTDDQKKLLSRPFEKQKLGIIKTIPTVFYKNTSQYRIGYTMVENTRIGKKWVKECNRMDAIFVPSQFLVDVFKECGVTRPVLPVKQGIHSSKFPYSKRRLKSKFIFGTIGYQDDRKNWKDLVQAFVSEFDNSEPVELWIKNSNQYWNNTAFNDPRIRTINRMYTFEEIQRLYSYFDCFVFPSHAEGSGLPPREAMATGLPVILTNWSGLTEIADPQFSYPLTPVAIDYPDVRGEEQPGFMARIDVTELMYWMRYVYEHQDEARAKGLKASRYIHKEWSWEACGEDMLQKIRRFL